MTGVTEREDLDVFCESPDIDYITIRVSEYSPRPDLKELGFLPFDEARHLCKECAHPEKIIPQFFSLDDEREQIRRLIDGFNLGHIIGSHASTEILFDLRAEGITVINSWQELSSDMDDIIGDSFWHMLRNGWDAIDLYVYPDYENGWELLLDEYPASLPHLQSLLSEYPLFLSLDITRENVDEVLSATHGALGFVFELRTRYLPWHGNANVFDRAQILDLAQIISRQQDS